MTEALRLHVEETGAGEPLVLLHGGAGTSEDLAGLRDRFVDRRRVISPEQRGHGRTPFAEPFTFAAMARDTAELIERLGVGPVDLVGWSDGAMVALHVARDRPDLVRRLVGIGITADPEHGVPPRQLDQFAEWLARAAPDELEMPAGYPHPDVWPSVASRILDLWRAPAGLTVADLLRIQAPMLFVYGDRDLFPLEDALAMAHSEHADLAIVPHADHRVAQTEPDLVARLIERFLRQPLSGAGGPCAAAPRPAQLPRPDRSRRSIRPSCV